MNCLCRAGTAVRSKWGRIHLVDKCLLTILAILMLQSALNLFFAASTSQEMNSIDVVIRTSAAGIFGYLISANFDQDKKRSGHGKAQAKAPNMVPAAPATETPVPQGRIGFDTGAAPMAASQPPRLAENQKRVHENYDRTQILIVAGVGVVSLCVILVYRNWFTAGPIAAGTLTQFRDFVSGSVGFLISCTTSGARVEGE